MDVLESFIEYLQFERRYSDHTITAYRKDLRQFESFLDGQTGSGITKKQLKKIDHKLLRIWLVQLVDQDISSSTVHRKISSLKAFYNYLIQEGTVEHNPVAHISYPKKSKRLPVFVPEAKLDKLFDQIPFKGDDFTSSRDRAILETFYSTGMRRSELINLKEGDIDFSRKEIKVLGKGKKERLIPMTASLYGTLQAHLPHRGAINVRGFYFFVRKNGEKLYPKLVYRLVNHYIGLVSTHEKKSPHILRHSFATHMLNRGADLNTVKELLGHSSLAATQNYTHTSIKVLQKAHKQAHPRA